MINKKELKEAYKQHKPQMGVFQIKNMISGQLFIDFSTDVEAKWNRHLSELRFGSHRNKKLQKNWKEYGESGFKFELISEIEYQEDSNPDYSNELKMLQDLILEELATDTLRY